MDSSVESALRLINVAIDLAANLESCASWLKLANVQDDLFFDQQGFQVEFRLALLEVPVIARLASTLRMADRFLKDDCHLTLFAFRGWYHSENFVAT